MVSATKTLLSLASVLTLGLALPSCGGDDGGDDSGGDDVADGSGSGGADAPADDGADGGADAPADDGADAPADDGADAPADDGGSGKALGDDCTSADECADGTCLMFEDDMGNQYGFCTRTCTSADDCPEEGWECNLSPYTACVPAG